MTFSTLALRDWFSKNQVYSTRSHSATVAQIIFTGVDIGSVTDVSIDDAKNVVITMSILKKYQKLISNDSVAELLNFKFVMLGKSVIEFSVGSPDQPVIQLAALQNRTIIAFAKKR